jgi:GDP-L-fucose synthase
MNVLVIGGSGLVGEALSRVCPMYKYPTRKELDLMNPVSVNTYLDKHKPKIIVNLAAHVGGLYDNLNNNLDYLLINTEMTMNLIKACKKNPPKKIINILSTCVFPSNIDLPLKSNDIHSGPPHDSNKGYSYAKRWSEIGMTLLGELCDTRVINLIPTNLYGINDNFDINTGHVLPALLNKFYQGNNDDKMYIKGDGKDLRQFVHADDFANIISEFVNKNFDENIKCIVANNEPEISIKDLVYYIKEISGFKGEIIFEEKASGGQCKKTVSDDELELYIKYTFKYDLKNGIKDVFKVLNHRNQK